MLREHGPVEALRESSTMLRTNWGKNLLGNFRIGLNLRIVFIPALVLAGLGTYHLVAGSLLIGPGLLVQGVIGITVGPVLGTALREEIRAP